ncbi:MAG TPA: outer membrane beta-barrel protein [Puia sp.]|nr:outer membrane beta-barrel protein [Puia sp.]
MKKTILSVSIAAFALLADAQTGSTLLYGNFGVASLSNSDNSSGTLLTSKETTVLFNLGVGYQYNANWTVGLNFEYNNDDQDGSTVSAYVIDPFIRYAKPLSGIFSIYGQLQAGYAHGSTDLGSGANGFNAQVFPAIFINIKNGFGLNFNFGGLQYISVSTKDNTGVSSSSKNFSFTFGQGLNFGISKNFTRK